MTANRLSGPFKHSPFNLDDDASYQSWRKAKLDTAHNSADVDVCLIADPSHLTNDEKASILGQCERQNFVLYQLLEPKLNDKSFIQPLGAQLGLEHLDNNLRADEDSVTSLEVRQQSGNQYIPYTNKPLSWHCDGYYNTLDKQINAIVMHCARPSASGGENKLLDHELLYIRLRDENPEYIKAMMAVDVMTIPPNIEQGVEIRAEQSGPVFSIESKSGRLHMRYSARKKNIQWKDNEVTEQARDMITECLNDKSLIFKHRLEEGQGIICNNVLHNRTGFEDDNGQNRLMYRARYYDRVSGDV